MKRDILCLKCGKARRIGRPLAPRRRGSDASGQMPEHSVKQAGFARRDYSCDQCGNTLREGALVYAATIWVEGFGIPYHPWEAEFIENPLDPKELDAHERLDSK